MKIVKIRKIVKPQLNHIKEDYYKQSTLNVDCG